MSVTTPPTNPAPPSPPPATASDMVTVIIDGKTHQVKKGTNLLEACNAAGADVPFFCYHPGLSSPAVCRQCLVDVKGQPKPVPSCYTPVTDKMEVVTNSRHALDVRRQMLEFTLVNHPIDCPICDKAGECTLQKHYFDWDAKYARNDGIKVKKGKAVDIGKHIVLDQERCILCTRCIRVCDEVAKSSDLTMAKRGDREILTTAPGRRLDNPYSLNTVDVCPVGALTAKDFRFRMRAWELESTPSVCTGCATGCNVEVHASRDRLYRLVPRENEAVNKHWMCDEGRFTYKAVGKGRLAVPLSGGTAVAWDKALDDAAAALRGVADARKLAVVFSAEVTNEDLFAFARLAFDHLGLASGYLAARPDGVADAVLVSADRNPNRKGAEATGRGKLRPIGELGADVRSGKVRGILAFAGESGIAGLDAGATAALAAADAVVLLATHTSAAVDTARVALPLAGWAEVDGAITNKQGLVQRLHRAIAPAGDALPGWDIVANLGRRLGASFDFESAKAVHAEARAAVDLFKTASCGGPVRPVQLRFANTRG